MKAIGSLQFEFYGTTSFTTIFHRHFTSLDSHGWDRSAAHVCGRVRWHIRQFPNGPQSGFRDIHDSASPPFHPEQRVFPDSVGDDDFHWQSFLASYKLKYSPTSARATRVYC